MTVMALMILMIVMRRRRGRKGRARLPQSFESSWRTRSRLVSFFVCLPHHHHQHQQKATGKESKAKQRNSDDGEWICSCMPCTLCMLALYTRTHPGLNVSARTQKIKALSRSLDNHAPARLGDPTPISRNLDPALHPFDKPREYTRALNAAKLDRMFAKPFVAAMDGHIDGVYAMAKDPNRLGVIASGSGDGGRYLCAPALFPMEIDSRYSQCAPRCPDPNRRDSPLGPCSTVLSVDLPSRTQRHRSVPHAEPSAWRTSYTEL